MRALLLLSTWACAGKCGEGGGDDTGDPLDTSSNDIVLPSGNRVLLSTIHNGHTGAITGVASFEDIDPRWKDETGWNTDWYSDLPADLAAYRMIGLIAPGYNGASTFSEAELEHLREALGRGTRVIVFGEHDPGVGACPAEAMNAVLDGLGAAVRFASTGADSNQIIVTDAFDPSHQMLAGVSSLRFKDPCHVEGGHSIVQDQQGYSVVSVHRPGRGGEVIAIGDVSFFDDSGNQDNEDNFQFGLNMIRVAP